MSTKTELTKAFKQLEDEAKILVPVGEGVFAITLHFSSYYRDEFNEAIAFGDLNWAQDTVTEFEHVVSRYRK